MSTRKEKTQMRKGNHRVNRIKRDFKIYISAVNDADIAIREFGRLIVEVFGLPHLKAGKTSHDS